MAGLNLGQNPEEVLTDQDMHELAKPVIEPTSAAFDLAWESTPVGAAARIYAQNESERDGGKKIDPRTLNETFPDIPEKFSEPMTMRTAQMISNRWQERRELERAMGKAEGFTENAATVGAGLLAHMMDPLSMAAGFGVGAVASRLGATGLTGIKAYSATVAENAIGNALLEPLVVAANKMDGSGYTAKDFFMNTIAPAVVLPAGILAGKKLLRYAGLVDPRSASQTFDAAVSNLSAGKVSNTAIELLRTQTVREIQGTEFRPYRHAPLAEGPRPFYAASREAAPNFAGTRKELIGELLGEDMVTLTDNPNVANGSAARAGFETPGKVYEMDVSGARLAQVEGDGRDLAGAFARALGDEYKPGMQATAAFESILAKAQANDEGPLEAFKAALKEQGFDGVAYKQEAYLGKKLDQPHNVVALFDEAKAVQRTSMSAEPDKVPRLSYDEASQLVARKLDEMADLEDQAFYADPDGIKDVINAGKNPLALDEEIAAVTRESKELTEQFAEMEKMGVLDADQLRELEEFRRLDKAQEKVPVLTAQAMACVRG